MLINLVKTPTEYAFQYTCVLTNGTVDTTYFIIMDLVRS